MISFPRRLVRCLAAGDRRLAARMSRGVRGEDGFVLLETLVAISLISVVMAAFTTFFVNSVSNTNQQRATQAATQLADSAVDQIRSLPASDVVSGRDATSVATQFANGNGSVIVKPWLQNMTPASDSTAATTNPPVGWTATIPTVAVKQTVNNSLYSVNTYLGTCVVATDVPNVPCTKLSDLSPSNAKYTTYLRAVIAVTWTGSCSSTRCTYVTSTLLSPDSDPTFNLNQTPPSVPSVVNPGDQVSTVGAPVRLQLALAANTGVPTVTWAVTAGVLPAGLGMTQAGLIAGVPTVVTPATSLTVTATDGLGRQASATFKWTVVAAPTIVTPPNQTTPINTSVSLPVSATCPNTPCTYTFSNAPVGLTIDPNTGLISGKPTMAGTVSVTVTVTDDDGVVATSDPFAWAVVSPASVCVPSVALPNGSFEKPGVFPGAPNWMVGGSSPLQWDTTEADNVVELWGNGGNAQAANGGIPITAQDGNAWAELNANDVGALYQNLTTVPGQVLQWSVWHRARGINGSTAGRDVMQVQIGTPASTTAQVPTGQTTPMISDDASAWVLYTGVYTVPAGQTTTRFQFAAISTASGDRSVGNFIDNLALNNNIACLTTAAVDLTSTINTAIAPLQISVDRGTGPFVWGGGATLPAGLSISSSGLITGTPTTTGTNAVVLTFSDATAFTQTVSFNWTIVGKPTITTPAAQTHSTGAVVNLTLTSFCGNPPCTYALVNGPAGLSIDANGKVTGTITSSAQAFSAARFTVTDAAGALATTGNFTWTVLAAPTITTPGAQTTTVGAAVSLAVTATCANTPCAYTLANAPPGLSINAATGAITGNPTVPGTYATVVITVTDKSGVAVSTANFTWTVVVPPTVTTPSAQTTTTGATVSLTVASTCPNSPCTFILAGAPAGLSINTSTGAITGTVTSTPQTFSNVTVRITDRAGLTATTASFTWTVLAKPTVTALAAQTDSVGAPVTRPLTKTCPNSPCSYVLNNGPAGLTITSAGVVTGTITGSPQTFSNVTVTITDSSGVSANSAAFTWTVLAAPTISTPAGQTSTLGAPVNLTVASTCANGPCTFTLSSAPPGLGINNSGVITGSPTVTGTYAAVSVTITDVDSSTATTANFTWTVLSAPTITKPDNQTSTVGAPLSLTVASTCPNTPCTFTLANAPTGLSINSSGVISGTPTVTGTSNAVSVTVTDKAGASASTGAFTWNVVSGPTVTKPAAQTTTVGAAVTLTLTKSCPNTPCSYVLNSGPAGLTITSAGVITGTVTSAAQVFSNVSITVTDNSGVTANSGTFSWTVAAKPTVTAPANQTDSVGSSVNLTLTKSCPNAPCSYVLNNGPGGLTITNAGVVTGTVTGPTQVFTNVSVTVTDNSGVSASSATFTWTVLAAPTVSTPPAQKTTVGAAVALTVASTCADAPCTFTLANAPPGLSINNSGLITGNPTLTGTYASVTVTVTDVDGSTATTGNFTWTVLAAPTVVSPGPQRTTTGSSVSLPLTTTCANAPCTYVLNNGPAGLSVNGSGVISGTITSSAQTFSGASVTVTDSSGISASTATFTWTVLAVPTIVTPAAQTTNVGATVNLAVAYTCANTPCTFTLANAPSGLSINSSTGVITGTVAGPAQVFSNVTVTVTDNSGVSATTAPFTWTVRSSSVGTLANAVWSVSRSATSATAVTYTYSYKTVTTANNLSSVSMSVPSGTAGTPVATVSGFTAANSTTTLSGNVLTVSFTPTYVVAGTAVSISIAGMTNTGTVGTYTSQVTTTGQLNGGAIIALDSATAGPVSFTTSTLINPVWSVSSSATNDRPVTYSYGFTTATAARLTSVTMTVPPGTAGTPAVTVTGLGAGTISLSGTVLTYTITAPVVVAAGVPVSLKIAGMTNTTLVGAFTSQLVTNITTGGVPVPTDSGVTGPISFTTGALINPVWSVSTATAGARATYNYSFITATVANPLTSVTMTVPPGTSLGTSPAATVAVAAASATGAVITLNNARLTLVGTVLTVSVDPIFLPQGANLSISVVGMINTSAVGTYTSQLVTNGTPSGATTTPIDSAPSGPISFTTGATLANAVWQVSNSIVSRAATTYTYRFNTATTATLSSVTMALPPGTAGTPAAVVTGLPAGTMSLAGGVLTYTLATPTSVNAGTAVSFTVSGLTNTGAVDSYLSQLVTFTTATGGASVPVDSTSSGPVAFTPGALGSPTWSASRTTAGATGVTYNYSFTTTTTGNPLTALTLTVPPGTGGTPSVSVPGLTGATITLSGTVLTVTAPGGQYVPGGTPVTITVSGLTNTTVTGSYTSQLVTTGSPPQGGAVNQLDSAITAAVVIS